jgi:rfaE bifunctional protein kinase chain/domain
LKTDGIISSSERITTTKFRVMSNRTQLLRVDEEIDTDLNEKDSADLLNRISKIIAEQKPDVIILQDYNKGVLSPEVIEKVVDIAARNGIPVAVDPKKKNFTTYKGITLFKPNLKEINEGLKTDIDPLSIESLKNAAELLHNAQDIAMVMITLSEHGIFFSFRNSNGISSKIIPAIMRSISDVSGAGDTVISVAALCLAAKTDHFLMAALSNLAGGLVCEKAGVVPVDKYMLMAEASTEL